MFFSLPETFQTFLFLYKMKLLCALCRHTLTCDQTPLLGLLFTSSPFAIRSLSPFVCHNRGQKYNRNCCDVWSTVITFTYTCICDKMRIAEICVLESAICCPCHFVRRCDVCENVVAVVVLLKLMGLKSILRCIG